MDGQKAGCGKYHKQNNFITGVFGTITDSLQINLFDTSSRFSSPHLFFTFQFVLVLSKSLLRRKLALLLYELILTI